MIRLKLTRVVTEYGTSETNADDGGLIGDMSQLDHIANRIGWRARKNAVWTRNTRMWKDASEELKERVGKALERPVFFSIADESEGMVFGADGAVVVSGDTIEKVPYLDLTGVRCSTVGIEAPSGKEFSLKLNVRTKGTLRAKVEGGAAGYGVWRVLQMVLKMGDAWFAPKQNPPSGSSEDPHAGKSSEPVETASSGQCSEEDAESPEPEALNQPADPEDAPDGAQGSGEDPTETTRSAED